MGKREQSQNPKVKHQRLSGLISPSTAFSRLAKVPPGKTLGWLLQGSCGNTGQQRA
jgi:hypothetical protein